jgi:HD-like signal output (HDOD) protein/AmiR/NasT family two-component response regulator
VSCKLLFVDDEPAVLSALQRVLRPLRSGWEMVFVGSGAEALKVLVTAEFDAVISDMKMPGMSGAELLEEVRLRHPRCLRFILSGESDKGLALRAANVAHQYLVKPCDSAELKQALIEGLATRNRLEDGSMMATLSQITSLPSLPVHHIELLRALEVPSCSNDQIGAIIERDLGLSAKLLKIANSALFGFRCQISTPSQAVGMLGTETIKTLALAVGIFSQAACPPENMADMEALSRHSLLIGSLSRQLARAANVTQREIDNAFTAGVLHDLGKLVQLWKLPEQWSTISVMSAERSISRAQAEYDLFGCSHAEIGGYLLGSWGLPIAIINAVTWHHRPSQSQVKQLSSLVFVHLAHALSRANPDFGDISSHVDRAFLDQCVEWPECLKWAEKVDATPPIG